MTCLWSLALVVLLGCRASGHSEPVPSRVQSLVEVGRDFYEAAPADAAWSEAELIRIADQVRKAMQSEPGRAASVALRETIFGALGFAREVDDTDLRFVLLPSVLRARRGTCVGLGTLYLALGELLNVPIDGVMRPGHFFVRFRDGSSSRNVELLHQGEEMPDAWYEARFPIPGEGAREYARALSLAEVLGIVEYDIGNERRRQGRLGEAQRAYERAVAHFPDFAEAQASLGTTLHLRGALDSAELHYRAALRANPSLPGLDRNIELLGRESAEAR
jgi:tetratricopeptide (TPR) repeat protein